MFRPQVTGRTGANSTSSRTNISGGTNDVTSSTTIREIRSRTAGSTAIASPTTKSLLANRRQAISMERLNSVSNSPSSSVTASSNSRDKDKSSPSNGSNNSINGSTGSSPSRNSGGLNRTASRVSRFRSAKAVFERLSSSNQNTSNVTSQKVGTFDKPRGTVANRYASTAAAKATIGASTSMRSRLPASSLARSHDSGRSASNLEINRSAPSNLPSLPQPKPQPRIVGSSRVTTSVNSKSKTAQLNHSNDSEPKVVNKTTAQLVKPPPKDLIDKIVLEIASENTNKSDDINCTIQDLSNCDISGIPDTLDFDRCFQDVEMMTEEEARKLLSRQSTESTASSSRLNIADTSVPSPNTTLGENSDCKADPESMIADEECRDKFEKENVESLNETAKTKLASTTETLVEPSATKSKVRFSEAPVKVYETHAVEDYDRRNDDIDPVAASAEYEIEKFKEREGIKDSDTDNINELPRSDAIQIVSNSDIHAGILHTPHNDLPHRVESHGSSGK